MLKIFNKEEFLCVIPKWLREVIEYHSRNIKEDDLFPIFIELRKHVYDKEVDMIVRFHVFRIGFELKDVDYFKACIQAIERREYFRYFYIVLNLSISDILHNIYAVKDCIKKGVGVISSLDDKMIFPSFTKNAMKQNERVKILDFLEKN